MPSKNLADEHRRRYERRAAGRRFLLKAVGLGAAGLAAGGGAAWATGKLEDVVNAEAATSGLRSQLEALSDSHSSLQLSANALQGQVTDLQGLLNLATSQNAQLAADLSASQTRTADLEAQLASAQSQLSAATSQLTQTRELIGLYDQLEAIGLDQIAESGVAAAAGGMSAVMGQSSLLRDGVAAARSALDSFELSLPGVQASMNWLGTQIVNLKVYLYAIEAAAQRTINSALAGLTASFGGFIRFVIDRLPFNVGKDVQATLSATQTVLGSLPDMLAGLEEKLLVGINQHIGDGRQGWKQTMVKPLRENTLAQADQMISAVTQADSTFTTSLKDPVQTALSQRARLREAIRAYRATHNL